MYIVVAGLDWPNFLDSTEKYDGSSWVEVKTAVFPYKIDGIRGVSINNNIFITGKIKIKIGFIFTFYVLLRWS